MRQIFRKSSPLVLLGLSSLMMACSDSTAPGDTVVGNYTAVAFTSTPTGGATRNELQAGSTLTMTLKSDGTTTGHLHIAANGASPVLDADMVGTFTLNGDAVAFTQAADTFVRNMVFTVQRVGNNVAFLVGDQVFSGTRVTVTLAKG